MITEKEINKVISNNSTFNSVLDAIIDLEIKKVAKKEAKTFLNEVSSFKVVIGKNISYLIPIAKNKEKSQYYLGASSYLVVSNKVRMVLDSEITQLAPINDKIKIFETIIKLEAYNPSSNILQVDKKLRGMSKLGRFACINSDTGITCLNRANGRCSFCNKCYAYKGCRYPTPTKKQLAKACYFHNNTIKQISKDLKVFGAGVVRINQEGEFNTLEDFLKVVELAKINPNIFFYSYTKNLEVLNWIKINGLPINLNIKDSNGILKDNHYLAVKKDLIKYYLSIGYVLCKGKCNKCLQCLEQGLNIITPLRP